MIYVDRDRFQVWNVSVKKQRKPPAAARLTDFRERLPYHTGDEITPPPPHLGRISEPSFSESRGEQTHNQSFGFANKKLNSARNFQRRKRSVTCCTFPHCREKFIFESRQRGCVVLSMRVIGYITVKAVHGWAPEKNGGGRGGRGAHTRCTIPVDVARFP